MTEAATQANAGLVAEIERLRGAAGQGSTQAEVMARFATATAAARAGDAAARQQLPGLSQAIEQAAQINATTSADIARVRAWLASSLQQTVDGAGAPGMTPSGAAGAGLQGGSDQTAQQLAALGERLAALEEPMRASALASAKMARLIDRAMPDGDALAVRVTT